MYCHAYVLCDGDCKIVTMHKNRASIPCMLVGLKVNCMQESDGLKQAVKGAGKVTKGKNKRVPVQMGKAGMQKFLHSPAMDGRHF